LIILSHCEASYGVDFLIDCPKIIRKGNLKLTLANGETHTIGDGTGEIVVVRIADEEAEKLIRRDPTLKLGEMYMDGRFILEQGNIYDFLAMVKQNTTNEIFDIPMAALLIGRIALQQSRAALPVNRNKRNVAHHYDLSERCSSSFSTRTGNIPAPITIRRASAWRRRSLPRSAISPPSCCSSRTSGCWKSAPAGAAWACIWRNRRRVSISPASR
jgi:hypothetical protein